MHTFSAYAEVRVALTDPALVPLPASERGEVGTMAWLRSQVARFSSGADHARRRAMVEADLAAVDPAALRVAAAADGAADERRVVVTALAGALGLADPVDVADAVVTASVTYFGGEDDGADRAVGWLLRHVLAGLPAAEPDRLERAANRIGLLIQAADATATLIAGARAALAAAPDAATALSAAMFDDPPVRVMRRVAARATRVGGVTVAAGEEVVLDIVAATRESGERLTFGVAPRVCPGREHALAIASARITSG